MSVWARGDPFPAIGHAVGIDTETELITDAELTPPLVVLGVFNPADMTCYQISWIDAQYFMQELLKRDCKLYFANAGFDYFELESDELVIWHALARTTDYGEITVSADGRVIDVFENRNPTLGQERKRFVGDGRTQLFSLGRAFTYGHRVLMNGRELRFKSYDLNYVSGPVAARFPGFDGVVVRARPEEKVEHFLATPSDYGRPWYGQLMAGPQMLAYMLQVNYWLEKYQVRILL